MRRRLDEGSTEDRSLIPASVGRGADGDGWRAAPPFSRLVNANILYATTPMTS